MPPPSPPSPLCAACTAAAAGRFEFLTKPSGKSFFFGFFGKSFSAAKMAALAEGMEGRAWRGVSEDGGLVGLLTTHTR